MKRDSAGPARRFFRFIGRFLLTLLTVILAAALILFGIVEYICSGPFPAAEKVLITTLLETGQLKKVAKIIKTDEEIRAIVDSNSLEEFNDPVDSSMIHIDVNRKHNDKEDKPTEEIEIEKVHGRNFSGTMMIVHDPSRVSIATIFPWRDKGDTLEQIVTAAGALGGINAGLYDSTNNTGGRPLGVVVTNGEIQYCEPSLLPGLVMVGLTDEDILQIVDINGKSKNEVIDLIKELRIRDAIVFQEESSDSNNHFVQLVINGKAREMNGMGSGLNPRTAIGQREDGSLLLLVTDGRGKNNHLGASASDLIDIMLKYGAVNAANLDGGSSSCMYYDDGYLQDSVTFYYTNSSWRMPCAFVIK